jgi:hypothetical protein
VNKAWLEIEVGGISSRADLRPGMTRLGGPGCDVVIPGAPDGELQVWSDPAKVIRISGRSELEVGGKCADETLLDSGVTIRWGGVRMTYHYEHPVLEEIPLASEAPPVADLPSTKRVFDPSEKSWIRVQAGLAIDLDLADRSLVKRWQEAVMQQEFDADACAREVLSSAGKFSLDDPRVIERSGRLLRDFLMSSLQRGVQGANRKIRSSARSGSAYLMANAIGILVYTAIVLVVMLLLRLKWGTSFDAMFDTVLGVTGQ